MKSLLGLLIGAGLAFGMPAHAQQKLDGWFIAQEACEAFQSKNNLTNPGGMRLLDSTAYDMIGINKIGGDWYQVKIPGAPVTQDRWVAKSCGVHVVAADPDATTDVVTPGEITVPDGTEATDLLIALSWQPAFCETRPSKTECRQINDGLLPITETQLSLHGLWPQPNGNFYCGVPEAIKQVDKQKRWMDLPAPELDDDTLERLAVAMPGVASGLDRHEWIKHGTCFFGDRNGDEYFDDSLIVLDAINGAVANLLSGSVGASLSANDIKGAFDTAFGAGAGDRVQIKCTGDGGRVLIQELRIALLGEITEDVDIGALILAADPQTTGCNGGIIDPVGLQ
ncbi:MAG: ribonuclease T [Pseudomonadota bacterium]